MLRRILASIGLAVLLAVASSPSRAWADGGSGTCAGASWGFQCTVQRIGQGGGAGGTGSGAALTCIDPRGAAIPCYSPALGTWDSSRGCYLEAVTPQPSFTDPIWNGNTNGAVYLCAWGGGGRAYQVWLANGPAAAPNPAVLAQQAVTQMRLRGVTIGMAPDPAPGSVGLVGLPIWLWVVSPDQGSWGPVSRTASAGGYSVTATGRVTQVVWGMGDGGTVACVSSGTAYSDSFGVSPSPDCGYRYGTQGTYTVTATSYWTINWSGIGQTGVIHQTYSSSVVVTIGELQTVVKG